MAKDPELKDAGEALAHQLRSGGLREASRYVMQAVREANIEALREAALNRILLFPKKDDGAAFRLPNNSEAAQKYLHAVASERLSAHADTAGPDAAPAPIDFVAANDSPIPKSTTEAVLVSAEGAPITDFEIPTVPASVVPIPFSAPDAEEDLNAFEPAGASEEGFAVAPAEAPPPADPSESPAPQDEAEPPEPTVPEDQLKALSENIPGIEDEAVNDQEHPYNSPFFDGVDRLFFAGDEALAYFVQRLYLRNLMPVDLVSANDASLTSGDEISVTLINKNAMSNMVDVTLQRNSSGATFMVFSSIKETESEARTLCTDMAWTQVQVDMAKGPREIRQPELRSREILFFWHLDDYLKVKDDLHQMSALMLSCQQDLTMAIDTDAIFQISGSQFSAVPAHIQPMGLGQMVASFPDRLALEAVMEEMQNAIDAGSILEDKATAGLSLAGTLCLPNSATELLEQHFQSQPTMGDLNQPSAIILLRVLTGAEEICEVVLKVRDGQTRNFFVQNGIVVFSRYDLGQLASYLSESGTVYTIVNRPQIPAGLSKFHIVRLLSTATRHMVETYEEDDLTEALHSRFDLAPKLTTLGEKRVHVLSLPKLLERHVTFKYNGQEVGRNLLLVEGDRKSGLSAMAVLEMHNFLEWQAPNLSLRGRKESLFEHFERIESANPFETMELHWFCAPIEIIESYHEHRQIFGPQGKRRGEAPEWSDKIWEKVESAFRFIDDKKSRDLYRKEHHDKKSRKDMATHLIKQARMDMFRNEDFVAQRKLEAAMDIYPNSAAQTLLDQISGKSDRE